MFESMKSLWRQPDLATYDATLTRERLIQNGRIVVVNDKAPLLIEELRTAGFAVDHDKTGNDVRKLDSQLYDVPVVDYQWDWTTTW